MNDEIKEILDNVKKCCDITKDQSFTVYQRQDILALLDYITNLQNENRTLKELNVCVGCNNNPDYKSRVEKAVEYINKNKHLSMFADCREPEEEWNYDLEINPRDLLNILQGESHEE